MHRATVIRLVAEQVAFYRGYRVASDIKKNAQFSGVPPRLVRKALRNLHPGRLTAAQCEDEYNTRMICARFA